MLKKLSGLGFTDSSYRVSKVATAILRILHVPFNDGALWSLLQSLCELLSKSDSSPTGIYGLHGAVCGILNVIRIYMTL